MAAIFENLEESAQNVLLVTNLLSNVRANRVPRACDPPVLGGGNRFPPVNSMWITGTITARQKVRQKVPGLYAVCR